MKFCYFAVVFVTFFTLFMFLPMLVYSDADDDKGFETIHLSAGKMADRSWRRKFREGKRPAVYHHPSNRSVVAGRGVTFHCKASGKPKLRIKWKKNGKTVTPNRRIKIREFGRGVSRLRIKPVHRSDSGHYSCLAKNKLGSDRSSPAYLQVQDNRKHSKARCELYTGSICSKYISSSTYVYLSPGQRQRNVEEKLSYLSSLGTVLSPACADHVYEFQCLQHFRVCNKNYGKSRPQQVCREDCQLIERGVCKTDLRRLRRIPIIKKRLPSCKNLPYAGGKTKCSLLSLLGNGTSKSRNSTSPRGKCETYKGTVCLQFIPKDQPIYVLGNQPQGNMENNLQGAISVIDTFASKGCKKFALKGLCYHFFPPCAHASDGTTAEPQLICRKDCELLQATVCSKEFELAQAMPIFGETLPACYNLPPSGSPQEKNCIKLGFNGVESLTADQCSKYVGTTPYAPSYTEIQPFNATQSMCKGSAWKMLNKFKIPGPIFNTIRNVKGEINKGKTTVSITSNVSNNFGATKYCFEAALEFGRLVREWDHYHKTVPLPNLRKPRDSTQISGLQLTSDTSGVKSIMVPLGTSTSYYPHDKLLFHNVTFFYYYDSRFGTIIGRGTYNLCDTVFQVEIRRLRTGIVMVTGQSNSPLDVSSVESVFGFAQPSNMLVDVIRRSKLLTTRLINPRMELYLDKDLSAKFYGKTFFGQNANPVFLEIFAGKMSRRDILLAGITSDNLPIAQAIEMFTGLSLPYIDLLQVLPNVSSVGMSLSTTTVNRVRNPQHLFSLDPLSTMLSGNIPEGLSFVSRNIIPVNCNKSQVCQLLQVLFGKGSLVSITTDTDWRRIIVNTMFTKTNNNVMANIQRVHVAMKIVNGSNAFLSPHNVVTFKVDGDVHYRDTRDKKKFIGSINYNRLTSVMQGQFSTQSVWNNAFGLSNLTFKNLRFGMTLETRKPHVENIMSGEGDFEFGTGCSTQGNLPGKSCITGHAHLGLSDDQGDHYFYGSVSPVSFQKLLQAMGITHQLPKAVGAIGFPNGLTISVARQNHDLRSSGGPNVKTGFSLSGKMNILGIETDASLSLLPREFLVNADISGDDTPVDIGGKTPLHDPDVDKKYGLKLYMKARFDPAPFLKAHIDGYERIFGIFDELRILVTGETFQIQFATELQNSFKAVVHLTTNYSSNLNTTHFKATVIFKSGLSKLSRLTSKNVITMLETEMTRLKTAEREVKRRRKQCAQVIKHECRKCLQNSTCKAELQRCYIMNRIKQSRKSHDNSELRKFCQKTAIRGCHTIGTTCRRACASIDKKANETCKEFREAARAQHQLEKGLKWVKQAETYMNSDLFKIHAIWFEATFSQINLKKVFVDTSIEITIFGQRHRLKGLKLKFKAFARLSSEIAKHAVSWYRKTKPRPKQRQMDNRPRSVVPRQVGQFRDNK